MLELATLGLLQSEPLHGYRLKQHLELFMSGCISANYGAIYPLLRRLEEQGAISVSIEAGEGSASRKVYSITEQGRTLWQQKMRETPHESWVNSRSRFLIKFFFFSHLSLSDRIKLIKHRLMVCRLRLESKEMAIAPTDFYEAEVWQRTKDLLQDEISWLEAQLQQADTSQATQVPSTFKTQAAHSAF